MCTRARSSPTWIRQAYGLDRGVRCRLHRAETPRPIIAVHLYGHPVDMDPIQELAAEHGIAVIEDATEALGSRYRGALCGTLGDIGCFSFNGNKVITSGGGRHAPGSRPSASGSPSPPQPASSDPREGVLARRGWLQLCAQQPPRRGRSRAVRTARRDDCAPPPHRRAVRGRSPGCRRAEILGRNRAGPRAISGSCPS